MNNRDPNQYEADREAKGKRFRIGTRGWLDDLIRTKSGRQRDLSMNIDNLELEYFSDEAPEWRKWFQYEVNLKGELCFSNKMFETYLFPVFTYKLRGKSVN